MRTSRLIGIAVSTICCLSLLSLLLVSEIAFGCDGDGLGMANPAAVYCHELGYEYKTVDTQEGQHGTCVFPDGSECEEWAFLEGACGQSYSYCARHGYDVVTKTDGKDPISSEYGVCVQGQQEVGPVAELMELSEKSTRGSYRVEQTPTAAEQGGDLTGSLLSSFSWRGWMTSVKNQGICGSCWAFSALGVVEAMYNIRGRGSNLDLSEEYLVAGSLAHDEENNCCGGETDEALAYVKGYGVPDEACLPYVDGDAGGCSCGTSCSSNCTYRIGNECSDKRYSADRCTDWQSRLRKISDTGTVADDQEAIKQKLVAVGPLSVVMCIGAACGGYYDGDIFKCSSASDVDHAVIIVGYNDAGGYWIVKNSWGVGFQDQGYFKVGYGQCLIETGVLYADLPGVGGVGGMQALPDVAQAPAGESASSGASDPPYAALAGGLAAAVVVLGAGAWYGRRRWLR